MQVFVGHDIPEQHRASIAAMVAAWSSHQNPKVRGVLLAKEPEQVLEQINAGRSVAIIANDGTVLGYCTFYVLAQGVWELGTVITNPGFREKGLGKMIYLGVTQLHQRLGGTIWETTHADNVVHLSSKYAHMGTPSYDAVPAHVRKGLCQEASCFRADPERPGRCSDEWNTECGTCRLCHRRADQANDSVVRIEPTALPGIHV